MDADAAPRERQRDPAGADAKLERGAVAGQLGEEVDDRFDDCRVEHVGARLVVPLRHALAEVVLGHGNTLAEVHGSRATADEFFVPKHRAALVLAGLLLLTGCGVAKEEATAPTRNVKPADLERMVQRQHLGPLARGFQLEQDASGPSNNRKGAEDTVDPKDTARALARAGRVRGYDLTYAAAKPSPLGVVFVSEGVELFRTRKAASNYLKKQFADFKRFRGRTIEGVEARKGRGVRRRHG